MKKFIQARIRAFGYAFEGWAYVLKNEPNSWIHTFISLCVISLALWLKLPARDWAVLLLTIVIVWAAEFFNTALESVVDLASPEKHPLAKISKDISAAGVLLAAITAVLVGLLILAPPLWEKLHSL
ncbi:MAG: diacylglycerol kinase family protein [Anaerolineae bacterium]|jgi:diacylglycerol kinase (ATP)|nr:diacylglycerol kinase family protein [Anaerolineae bacterium]MBT7069730.1 diacylglycerol kinase family protein [Anaerolineae bacterium]MBT7326744.1 diacylglycerol kinase family protein [Anaerolineae bacterium]